MQPSVPFFDLISLYPFISKLLWVKFKKISYLSSFIYITLLTKLKPKTLKIKPISSQLFEQLIQQSSYKFEILTDTNACALVSVNTLVALSISNKSWVRIAKVKLDSEQKLEKNDVEKWKIKMPPVEKHEKSDKNSYLIQLLAVSSEVKDFTLYVTNEKLFNISHHWSENNVYCDLVDKVDIQSPVKDFFPKLSKSATVAAITSAADLSPKDFEEILDEYFSKPRCLKVNEVFQVFVDSCEKELKSKISNVNCINFRVINLTGESEEEKYLVLKGYTNLYLNPAVHGYIPQQHTKFIKTRDNLPGFDSPLSPSSLTSNYKRLWKLCKLFLKNINVEFKSIFLICGPEGSGKKTLVKSVASSFGLHFLYANCFDLYGQNPPLVHGKLDQIFAKARRTVPCIVYLENVELLGREQNYNENARLIDIFESHIKELWVRKPNSYPLILFGASHSKTSEIIPAIGRLFIQTITIEPPKLEETYQILKWAVMNFNMICCSSVLMKVAERAKGYVLADLKLLVKHAMHFQNEGESGGRVLLKEHFDKGIALMEAAYSDSIGAARVPTVHWDDIGGLADLKEEIMLTLNLPMKHPELFASGLKRSGIMFYGPPGTGKTLMAKAVATECNYNFLSVKGPELMNMYVGQSEKNVREVFERAREAAPCIIFFDELDSLAPSRGRSGDSGGVTDRVVSQLLAEMDGLDRNKDVFVIAATNRPDLVDPALLRPGRFDKMFYVGVCGDDKSKLSVLKALTKRFLLDDNVDFEEIISQLPEQVTGADLYSVCSNAWFVAARRAVNTIEEGIEVPLPIKVFLEDFLEAVQQFVPSLTAEDMMYYESLKSSEREGPACVSRKLHGSCSQILPVMEVVKICKESNTEWNDPKTVVFTNAVFLISKYLS